MQDEAEDRASGKAEYKMSVGLVLSAGGNAAESWHAGVLNALADAAGWDARSADLIVGTSAGAVAGLCLRAGVAPADLYARQLGEPLSDEAQEIAARVTTERPPPESAIRAVSLRPHSLRMSARELLPPQKPRLARLLVGLTPRGLNHNDSLGHQMAELHPEPWPSERLWVVAVRLSDGKRVVFGRDDVNVTVWDALRASCTVPCRDEPVVISGHEYVDGGIHSYVNADLMGPPAFDAAVVSSVAGGEVDWEPVRDVLRDSWTATRTGLGSLRDATPQSASTWMRETVSGVWADGLALRTRLRQAMEDQLRHEVAGLRNNGISVLVVRPDAEAVKLLSSARRDRHSSQWQARLAATADAATRRALATSHGQLFSAVLRQTRPGANER